MVIDSAVDNVVFDLGGVLIDWNPRYVFRTLFDDEEAMERFLAEICTPEWNAQQDAGRPWAEAIRLLVAEHPDFEPQIRAYYDRWQEMLGGPIQETVDVLAELHKTGVRLFGLSNWSGETFVVARQLPEYAFLGWFEAVVISGEVGIAKPDPRIFRHLIDRYGLEPSRTLFIDDVPANIQVASDLGMRAVRFVDGESLRAELGSRGLLNGRVA
jgi:2-haloacid dehalogenase